MQLQGARAEALVAQVGTTFADDEVRVLARQRALGLSVGEQAPGPNACHCMCDLRHPVDVHLRVLVGLLDNFDDDLVRTVHVRPPLTHVRVLLRIAVASRIHELRVGVVLRLVDDEDPAVALLQRGAVAHVDVLGVVAQGDPHADDVPRLWLRAQVVGRECHHVVDAVNVRIGDVHDVLGGDPAQLALVAQAVVQPGNVRIVAHPIERVAVLEGLRARVRQAQVVAQLMDRDHDLKAVGNRLTTVANCAPGTNPSDAFGAHWVHLGVDDVNQVVVPKGELVTELGVALQGVPRFVVERREGQPAGQLVSVPRVVDHLGNEGDVQLKLAVGHLRELPLDLWENLLLVKRKRVGILLRIGRQRLISGFPVHDQHKQTFPAQCPPVRGRSLPCAGNEAEEVWVPDQAQGADAQGELVLVDEDLVLVASPRHPQPALRQAHRRIRGATPPPRPLPLPKKAWRCRLAPLGSRGRLHQRCRGWRRGRRHRLGLRQQGLGNGWSWSRTIF
mmetsp:Transcript_126603/g.405308  ORF Transcript_126603/g.405308 Transcript_126603/m.405308 type:complete len:503 (+) Transcript_126603:1826-3334(+)